MPTKQGTPGGGSNPRIDHFSYEPLPPDKPWFGWLAGEPRWIYGHTKPRPTKICTDWATDGRIKCFRCGPKSLIEFVGYVPVYRESDGAPILVIVHDTSFDFLAKCKHPDYVRVVRQGAETEAVTVQKALSQKKMTTSLKRRTVPVGISELLVRLWNINEYTEWYAMQPGNKPVTQRATPEPDAKEVEKLVPPVDVPVDATESETLASILERRKRMADAVERGQKKYTEIQNGKHVPKPPT